MIVLAILIQYMNAVGKSTDGPISPAYTSDFFTIRMGICIVKVKTDHQSILVY